MRNAEQVSKPEPKPLQRRKSSSFKANEFLDPIAIPAMRAALLAWYRANHRKLPWRGTNDPYPIWISEIMLQQTRVAAVLGRYEAFLAAFPTVAALAAAEESNVLALWSGLGYYRRARMMHRAAKQIVADPNLGGSMPASAAGLRLLPGIGAYTSAAIASIAYGEAAAVVDGNVERVVQRLAGLDSNSELGQTGLARQIASFAASMLDPREPGDSNQAMMELGATVCLPRNPQCLVCPLRPHCQTQGEHLTIPRAKMRSEDVAYALALRQTGSGWEVLLVQRDMTLSVMPGLWELPSLRNPIVPETDVRMKLRHAIMQVNYRVTIREVAEEQVAAETFPAAIRRWMPLSGLDSLPMTGLARKVLRRIRPPGSSDA